MSWKKTWENFMSKKKWDGLWRNAFQSARRFHCSTNEGGVRAPCSSVYSGCVALIERCYTANYSTVWICSFRREKGPAGFSHRYFHFLFSEITFPRSVQMWFFFFTPFLSHEAFCVRVLAGCIKIYLFFMLQTVVLLFLQTFKEADIFHHDCDLVDCNDGCFHRHHLTIEIIQLLSP